MYAEVIIPLALPRNYTWSVPAPFRDIVRPGVRVEVVLGANKKYAGLVKGVTALKPPYATKDILNVLDTEPVIFPPQLKLWEWISAYYMCGEGEVMAAALPAHFKLSSETVLICNEEFGEDFSDLDHDEFLLAEALNIKKELTISEVQQLLDNTRAYPVIKRLIDKKVCFVWEALKETYTAKKESYVRLNPAYGDEDRLSELLNNWARAPKQLELLLSYLHLYKTEPEVTRSALLKKSGASDAHLKGLIEKDILLLEKKQVGRIAGLPQNIMIDFDLTESQQTALEQIEKVFDEKDVCLLHGVTSSGKTQVYIKLLEKILKSGRQALYLLPEIALTTQIIRRLQKHFGGYIGIYHSRFSQNERIEIWNKVKSGELKIVLGARSSLFLPFSALSLVIVDEEHDGSYKQQDPAPRYHARDTAIYYGAGAGAKILLGSATPSIESYFNARSGKYGLVTLNERYLGMAMPEIDIVDLKKVPYSVRQKQIVTPHLKLQIEEALEQNKQVILFQNRRGYSPYQVCLVCGWIPHCRNCDVTLTFHKRTHKLHCHYCGQHYPPVYTCVACGSDKFAQKNFGTEKIEEQLEEMFPAARIARMDIDSVRGKHAHDNLIRSFEAGRIDIMVGTQMVVKGLDFEHVKLVGVLDADSLLHFADFRVNERAFQLIEQVSGRAGRKGDRGKMVIQVLDTAHPLLKFLSDHDYAAFFDRELDGRKKFVYPPFSRLILVTFRHRDKDIVEAGSQAFAELLKPELGSYLVGPAEPVVNRVRNQYLMELLLKLPKDGAVATRSKALVLEKAAQLRADRRFRNIIVVPDVDP